MAKKDIKFSGEINIDQNAEEHENPQNASLDQEIQAKQTIMDTFNVSEEEAERILRALQEETEVEEEAVEVIDYSEDNFEVEEAIEKKEVEEEFVEVIGDSEDSFEEENEVTESAASPETEDNSQETDESVPKDSNVDLILSDIIPDYNKHISIEVDHVDLTFVVAKEKIDTIKEKVIRTIKRQKTDKIRIHALNDVSFKVYKGEKVGVIGYNGAGKSTLLHVICGAFSPDKGTVKTHGRISPLLGLGAGFDYNYSGRKNIFFNGAVLGYDKEFLKQKEQEIIDFSELGEYIDMPIKNYSSGMLSKLGFSIATIVTPDILVIDEVLGVGDITFRKKSRDKIRSLMDGGTTVLLVSHSIPTVREICDKAIWIDKGKIREIGEVNKVCDHYIKDSENASNEQLANIQFT